MSRLTDWIFNKQDYENVRLSFWGAVLLIGTAWLVVGVIIMLFHGLPGFAVWYHGLSFSDQMALIFGVPSVMMIVIGTFVCVLFNIKIFETYQRKEEKE